MTKQERLWRDGEAFLAAKKWMEAAACFQALVASSPNHVPAILHWAGAAKQCGEYRRARELVVRAAALDPVHPALVAELLRRLRELNEGEPMFRLLAKSRFATTATPAMLADVAMRIGTLGAHALALELVEAALRGAPQDPKIRYLRASILMYFGRNADASNDLNACLARDPGHAQAIWLRSRLRRATPEENAVDALRRQLARGNASPAAQVYLAYALHNELHDLADYDAAWQALMHGARAKRSQLAYDGGKQRQLLEHIRNTFDSTVESGAPDADGKEAPDYLPIFIVGMYRSGTTLLERILAGHSGVADGGETYIFTSQLRTALDYPVKGVLDDEAVRRLQTQGVNLRDVGLGYMAASRWRADGARALTEKLPSNLLNAGIIARALPRAKLLHSVRDPVDTCFSNLRTLFSGAAPYSYDLRELGQYFVDQNALAAHWRATLPGHWKDVPYHALVNDTEATARDVTEFLGIAFEADALDVSRSTGSVATASSVDVRKGILRDRGQAWKPYERHLGPLVDVLATNRLI